MLVVKGVVGGKCLICCIELSVLRFPFIDYYNCSEETVSTYPILSVADVIASAAKQSPIQHGDCFSRNERSFAMTQALILRA
ncbi:MAG: hypothetical protein ACPL3P_00670 [Anaerolineales bacterium]